MITQGTLETEEKSTYIDRELYKSIIKLVELYDKVRESNQHSIEFLESYSPIEKTIILNYK